MKIHFIAIGGSAMHNLAIALSRSGVEVSGSDDEIFEPSRGRLKREGILPENIGWFPEKIHPSLDGVILGMHARADNPELKKARELSLPIYSYPEYIYQATRDKKRIVIGGSHGKTTITSMLLHVMKNLRMETDYLVGAQLEGYDCMVRLSEQTTIAVLEGDEYLSSPIDRRPKFHLYKPTIALLTGIAWDHINVFPSFENYLEQFRIFIESIEEGGTLVYYEGDPHLRELVKSARADIKLIPYSALSHYTREGMTYLKTSLGEIPLGIFGSHNMENLAGAKSILSELGVTEENFFTAFEGFKGASKRLELVASTDDWTFYKDFAHAPSKLKATTSALKEQYPDRELVACMELHTFSSLNKKFLPLYKDSMKSADRALVYFSPEVVRHKKLEPISPEEVKEAFGSERVEVFTDSKGLLKELKAISWKGKNLLMMSSGNFDGIHFDQLGEELRRAIIVP